MSHWDSLEGKKEIPDRSAKGCKRLREGSQLWRWEEGQGRLESEIYGHGVSHEARSLEHCKLAVTSFTCDLLESWPSSSMGRLLNPTPGPSPEEHVAGE